MVDSRGPLDLGVSDAYPWIFAAGALISFLWLAFRPLRQEGESTASIDAGLVVLIAGLLGARIGYVATHWNYFGPQLEEAFYFWQGGLSWTAGAIAALIALAIYSLLSRVSFKELGDSLAIPAAIIAAAAWLGCLIDRCAYGLKTSSGLLTPPAPDMIGNIFPRWPTQTIGLLLSLAAIAALYWLSHMNIRPGLLGALSLSLVALIALALSFTRGDPMPALAGMRLDGLSSAALLSLGLVAIGVSAVK